MSRQRLGRGGSKSSAASGWCLPDPVVPVQFSRLRQEAGGRALYGRHREEMVGNLPSLHLGNVWSKLRAYAGRLTLLVHVLHQGKDAAEVGVESVERAWQLVNYFKSHTRRVYGVMNADPDVKQAARILGWIRKRNGIPFTRSEAISCLKTKSVSKSVDLSQALQLLVSYGYIRRVASGPQRGRPAERYEVNPSILQ